MVNSHYHDIPGMKQKYEYVQMLIQTYKNAIKMIIDAALETVFLLVTMISRDQWMPTTIKIIQRDVRPDMLKIIIVSTISIYDSSL